MAKNYESESRTNKNNAGISSKNMTSASGRNASRSEMNSQNHANNESNANDNSQSRTQSKNAQSCKSEGNSSSRY